jgi:hypothetical protein
MRLIAVALVLLSTISSGARAVDPTISVLGIEMRGALVALDTKGLTGSTMAIVAGYNHPGDGGGGLFFGSPIRSRIRMTSR